MNIYLLIFYIIAFGAAFYNVQDDLKQGHYRAAAVNFICGIVLVISIVKIVHGG